MREKFVINTSFHRLARGVIVVTSESWKKLGIERFAFTAQGLQENLLADCLEVAALQTRLKGEAIFHRQSSIESRICIYLSLYQKCPDL